MYNVTVIITTHNRSNLLVNSVNSVLNQTYKEFKLLIIDDASTDNTEKIIKTFIDNRIQYIKISMENTRGGNHARNLGIKNAEGDFIAFLDDDDEWMPEKLEKQLNVFYKDKKIGIVGTGVIYISNDGKEIAQGIPVQRGDLSKDILIANLSNICFSSIMVKKEIIVKAGMFDENMPACQDYDMYIRVCQICEFDYTDELLTKYYDRNDIDRIGNNVDKYESAFSLINNKYKDLIKLLDKKSDEKRKEYTYNALVGFIYRNKDYKKLKKYYINYLSHKFDLKIFLKLCFYFIGIYHFNKMHILSTNKTK